ncbi:MAG TPA: HlyD family efflux transporter periplasmic adaptor subunit [Kiloniellales bacterium]|nr:HlyD family efflux transporter periplasmic adaptor subunit [Kiloniellales bacterium]
MSRWLKRLLLIPPVTLGVLALVWLVMQREPPERHPLEERSVAVRVVEVFEAAVVPRVLGHGVVEPSRVWEGVAEIGAHVVEEHENLARGAFLHADTLLLRLDTTDIELGISRAEAAKAVLEAQLDELERNATNTRASLVIEERALELAEAELQRQRALQSRGTVSQAVVDREERQTVVQRQAVQKLENQLALHPASRMVLTAQLRKREAELASARRDLERAEVRLPFDARISEVNVRAEQYASLGQVLVVADGMDRAEVNAQVPMDRMRRLVPATKEMVALTPEAVAAQLEALDLKAIVRLTAGDMSIEWPGEVARMSDLVDPSTRTVGVIVELDQPYDRVVPGRVPPLVKSMFVEVELQGSPSDPLPVIPRTALTGSHVYLADEGERLEQRLVEVAFLQGEIAVIAAGLETGERVVVSDPVPAIEGMRLEVTHDDLLRDRVQREATNRDEPT